MVMKKSCKICIYSVRIRQAGASALVCVNKEGSPGRLKFANKAGVCRNFQTQKVVNRPEVIQPTDTDIRLIPLTRGKVAIVDKADYDWLIQYKWYANKKAAGFYAATHIGPKLIYMHRLIMQSPTKNSTLRTQHYPCRLGDGFVVDHIDRNSLNNRRSNLRRCTQGQNLFNQRPRNGSSKYKGVSWNKKQKQWSAAIEKNNKQFHLGYFNNEKDAAMAYDAKAKELFGQFAYLNFTNDHHSV